MIVCVPRKGWVRKAVTTGAVGERRGGEGRGEGQWSPLGRGRKGWALREKRLVYWLVYSGKDEVVRCIPYSGKARMRLGKAGEGWGKAG